MSKLLTHLIDDHVVLLLEFGTVWGGGLLARVVDERRVQAGHDVGGWVCRRWGHGDERGHAASSAAGGALGRASSNLPATGT